MPDLTPEDRGWALLLAGFLRGLAGTDRHALSDHDRDMLRRASGLLARVVGYPDLDRGPGIGTGPSSTGEAS